MKVGDTYKCFGATWIVDHIYNTPKEWMMSTENPFGLVHPVRYHSHVIEAPEGYNGATEMDTAYTEV